MLTACGTLLLVGSDGEGLNVPVRKNKCISAWTRVHNVWKVARVKIVIKVFRKQQTAFYRIGRTAMSPFFLRDCAGEIGVSFA